MDKSNDAPKGYEGRKWLKHWEVLRLLDKLYSASCIKQLRQKGIIRSRQPYPGANFQYNKEDVFGLLGWV
jgi:hypothetical protein